MTLTTTLLGLKNHMAHRRSCAAQLDELDLFRIHILLGGAAAHAGTGGSWVEPSVPHSYYYVQ